LLNHIYKFVFFINFYDVTEMTLFADSDLKNRGRTDPQIEKDGFCSGHLFERRANWV
jgi:hypothetical protein